MPNYYPLLIVGAIIGVVTTIFIIAYAMMKDKKTAIGFDRNMKDSEILRRMGKYVKPHIPSFVLALLIIMVSIVYDIVAPLMIGGIEELIKEDFELSVLFTRVAIFASILIVSLVATYLQAIILQKVGQRILSTIRQDLFVHIESLSHSQLHEIPVGKLVTRVTNDTGAISMMFTNLIVNLIKNIFFFYLKFY